MTKERLYLESIRDSLERIAEYTATGVHGLTLDSRRRDPQSHVIGEATKNLSAELRAANPEIPWRQIAAMRDVLIHDYLKVNLARVWRTVAMDLPPLQTTVHRLLEP